MTCDTNLSHIWRAYVASGKEAYEAGNLDEAEHELKENLQQLEHIVHNREIVMSELLLQLANIARDRGNFDTAESDYERATALREKQAGELSILPILEGWSLCLSLQGKYAAAAVIERRIFKIEALNRVKDATQGNCLARLAILSRLMHDTELMREYLERYLHCATRNFVPTDHRITSARQQLAQAYFEFGQYEQSEKQYEILLDVVEQSGKGPDELTRHMVHDLEAAHKAREMHLEQQMKRLPYNDGEIDPEKLHHHAELLEAFGLETAAKKLRDTALKLEQEVKQPC
jgi:tetratricopeptide (TPR) repeat protein